MAYETTDDLKYIDDLGQIPVAGEGLDDSWSQDKKLAAAEVGEKKLESDVNDGQSFDSSDVETLHGEAAATWATYKLILGFKSPDSSTVGDSLDEGTDRTAFAEMVKDMYSDYVSSISQADHDEGEESTEDVSFTVVDL